MDRGQHEVPCANVEVEGSSVIGLSVAAAISGSMPVGFVEFS